jgi:N-acetylmuramoyl-L-alanine amidase
MASSVFKGIRQYFYQHPPAGTYIAAQVQSGSVKDFERQHTVVSGDSMSGIATRYGVSSQRLMQYNNLRDTNVKIGQTLKIPAGNAPAVASQPIVQSPPPVAQSRPVVAAKPALPRQHKVVAGDTLSRIATIYGVSVSELQKHNKMKNATVKIGQTIKIPTT